MFIKINYRTNKINKEFLLLIKFYIKKIKEVIINIIYNNKNIFKLIIY